jgi:hypothetical protein
MTDDQVQAIAQGAAGTRGSTDHTVETWLAELDSKAVT